MDYLIVIDGPNSNRLLSSKKGLLGVDMPSNTVVYVNRALNMVSAWNTVHHFSRSLPFWRSLYHTSHCNLLLCRNRLPYSNLLLWSNRLPHLPITLSWVIDYLQRWQKKVILPITLLLVIVMDSPLMSNVHRFMGTLGHPHQSYKNELCWALIHPLDIKQRSFMHFAFWLLLGVMNLTRFGPNRPAADISKM